jgi:hypothetical protein
LMTIFTVAFQAFDATPHIRLKWAETAFVSSTLVFHGQRHRANILRPHSVVSCAAVRNLHTCIYICSRGLSIYERKKYTLKNT